MVSSLYIQNKFLNKQNNIIYKKTTLSYTYMYFYSCYLNYLRFINYTIIQIGILFKLILNIFFTLLNIIYSY